MKKIGLVLCALVGLIAFNSCKSMALDLGYFPIGQEPKEGFATVNVEGYLTVTKIDDTYTKSSSIRPRPEFFTIEPGLYTFTINYNDGYKYNTQNLLVRLEKNKTYNVTYKIGNSGSAIRIYYHVVDTETKKNVELNKNALYGKEKTAISQFIDAVLNPTSDEINKTVIEENDEFALTSLPGMKYELLDKKTNTIQKGYKGFNLDFNITKGILYLYETDIVSSKEEFLKTNYTSDSKIVLEVTECDSKTVTYTYVKPESLAGKTVKFNISIKN